MNTTEEFTPYQEQIKNLRSCWDTITREKVIHALEILKETAYTGSIPSSQDNLLKGICWNLSQILERDFEIYDVDPYSDFGDLYELWPEGSGSHVCPIMSCNKDWNCWTGQPLTDRLSLIDFMIKSLLQEMAQ